jgi:hypothetical protein
MCRGEVWGVARVLALATLVLAVGAGSLVPAASSATRRSGAAPKVSPGTISEIVEDLQKAISYEEEATVAIREGEKGAAILALGSAIHEVNLALHLDGGPGNHESPSYAGGVLMDKVISADSLDQYIIERHGVSTADTRRLSLIADLEQDALPQKRHALEIFQRLETATSVTSSTGDLTTASPQSCIDILRDPMGEVANFTVDDPSDAHDQAAVTFTTPSGFDHTISITLDAAGMGVGSFVVPSASEVEIEVRVTVSPTLPAQTSTYTATEDGEFDCTSVPTAPPKAPTETSTGTSTTGSSAGCAVVHPQQSCSFTARGSTIVLAGTGRGALLIENQVTGQGSSFPAPTTSMFTPIPGDKYTVRNYSNADMTVRQQ